MSATDPLREDASNFDNSPEKKRWLAQKDMLQKILDELKPVKWVTYDVQDIKTLKEFIAELNTIGEDVENSKDDPSIKAWLSSVTFGKPEQFQNSIDAFYPKIEEVIEALSMACRMLGEVDDLKRNNKDIKSIEYGWKSFQAHIRAALKCLKEAMQCFFIYLT